MNKKRLTAFTLVELIVVIAIMAVLITLSFIYFDDLFQKGRDSQRISDITQIQNALNLYHRDEGSYPTTLTFGGTLVGSTSSSTYMLKIPQNPTPRDDSNCSDNEYTYTKSTSTGYYISFCLGGLAGAVTAGNHYATPQGIADYLTPTDGLKLWLKGDGKLQTRTSGSDTFVTSWRDSNGSNYALTQSTEGNQPKLVTGFNNKPMVYFNGTTYLDNATILTGANFATSSTSIFIVYGLNGTQINYGILMNSNIGSWWCYNGGAGYFGLFTTPRFEAYPATMPTTGNHLIAITAGANYNVTLDGTDLGSQAYSWNLGSTLTLGKTDTIGLDGYVAEMLIYNKILSDAEITLVEEYLNNKYGL